LKINKLRINAYGKIKNKEIELTDGINIIYGKNESGKSTILKFILNSFYGTSKNKKGKNISDYEKYKPWNLEEFSGKLEYELDNKEKYEIYREFNKKNPKIFNKNGEDISKRFNIDKNKGNEFFYEQTKIDEELFLSTATIMQQEVKIDKNMQNILIQKISNVVRTGEDNVSYKKALDKLNKKQLEEIGTERTREKPINVISQKITEIQNKLKNQEFNEQDLEKINEEKIDLINTINENEIKLKLIKEIKNKNNNINLENEKIKINKKIKDSNSEKINELKSDLNKIKNNNKNILEKNNLENKKIKKQKNKLNKKLIFIFLFLSILNILYYIFITKITENKIIKNIFLLTVPSFIIFACFSKKIQKNKIKNIRENEQEEKNKLQNEIINLENEINILEKNKNEIENEINKLIKEINLKNNLENEKIKNNYLNKLEIYEIDKIINLENLENYENEVHNKINYLKLELHKNEIEKNNLETEKEKLSNYEEELSTLSEKYVEIDKLNQSIELTKEILENCYNKMRENLSPKFTEMLSLNIANITNGKYNKVKYTDEEGLIVELENGNYVSAELLSVGTIDQLYLSLRLAMTEEISSEKMPLILDEVFAYYDEQRLENILKYIKENFEDKQIIILTCTKREENIFDKLQIGYNLVNI